ncbi:MAG: response regulator [Burkholderiales bacterium]|nr:response regulator [Burkholderiales bacterium]
MSMQPVEGLVYVVDDVECNRLLGEAHLKLLGWRVRTLASAREALLALREETPQSMLVDMRMPEMTGRELASLLQSRADTRVIRLVGYTAHAHPDEIRKFREAGFAEVLIKPAQMADMERVFGRRA